MNNIDTFDQVASIARRGEAYAIIVKLYDLILNCDETERECDVCLGIKHSIRAIENRLAGN